MAAGGDRRADRQEAFTIFRGLDFYANERWAGFFSFDYSWRGGDVSIFAVLDEPVSGG